MKNIDVHEWLINKGIDPLHKVGDVYLSDILEEHLKEQLVFNATYSWLKKDDLDFAIELQKENKLEAVKWLCEKAKPYVQNPLKQANEILSVYR